MLVSTIQSLVKQLPRRHAGRAPLRARPARALRIAVVTEYYYPHLGGVCEHVHFFARAARRRGHRVDIITSRIAGAADMEGVIRIGHSMPVYANGSLARITVGVGLRQKLRAVLREGRYDLVHVHSPLTSVLPLLAIEEAEVPIVGTFHTYLAERSLGYTIFRRYCQKRLDRLDAAIAVSHAARETVQRYFDTDCLVIPNGVDTSFFRPDAAEPSRPRGDMRTVLFVGRFDPRNGFPLLLEAVRRVRRGGQPVRLVVVGDGPRREQYAAMAAGDADVEFVGPVLDERPRYYAEADVYACPTSIASFGITLLEAAACATPIVCSDIRGFDEVVSHEREALMVRPGDADALADGLRRVLADDALRLRLGAAGRERALQFDWERVTDRVLDVYARLLGHASAAA